MGYDLHITRAEHWHESERNPISAEEWLAIVAEDPELSLVEEFNGPYFALWSGPSGLTEPWFDWADGRVYTKNPDVQVVEKMIGIAAKLSARVVGDDGETYPGPDERDPYRLGTDSGGL